MNTQHPICDYTGRPSLHISQVCRCEKCQAYSASLGKIQQIAVTGHGENQFTQSEFTVVALCTDGSLWIATNRDLVQGRPWLKCKPPEDAPVCARCGKVIADPEQLCENFNGPMACKSTAATDIQGRLASIMEKCEFYWNHDGVPDAEIHAVLERIHDHAREIGKCLGKATSQEESK